MGLTAEAFAESVAKQIYLTPPEAAKELRVSPDKVLTWIHSGELRAFDVSAARGQRPRWRIARADLDDFLARRAATPPQKPQRRRRRQAKTTTYY